MKKRDRAKVIDYVGLGEEDGGERLVFFGNSSEVEDEFLKVKRSLLQRFYPPPFVVLSGFADSRSFLCIPT